MRIIPADQEAKIISYLNTGDPRGTKLLRKHYAAPLYGMIKRMRSCPIQSTEILESAFDKIRTDIRELAGNHKGFFTWVMQVARKLSIAYGEVSVSPVEQQGEITDTAFSLVMHRGFSLAQAAVVLGVSTQQVAMGLRSGLKESVVKVIKPK